MTRKSDEAAAQRGEPTDELADLASAFLDMWERQMSDLARRGPSLAKEKPVDPGRP